MAPDGKQLYWKHTCSAEHVSFLRDDWFVFVVAAAKRSYGMTEIKDVAGARWQRLHTE